VPARVQVAILQRGEETETREYAKSAGEAATDRDPPVVHSKEAHLAERGKPGNLSIPRRQTKPQTCRKIFLERIIREELKDEDRKLVQPILDYLRTESSIF